ncbi:MAG: C4-dicarboxylate TRAP transporter substrate-binding protein [Rhodospirillales bacterium]|nr:C4-dicarboxylate TRAP transporter substrate-binding protein [Rhodospirillales bacterium]
MKNFTKGVAVATVSTLLSMGGAFAASFTLSVNTALSTDDPVFKGLEQFRENVIKATGGDVDVRLFPGSQLGSDEDVLEQARAGANVAVSTGGERLAVFTKEFGILGAPYLFDTYDEARKVVTSPLFEAWVEKLRKAANLQVLSFNQYEGSRHLLTNRPVKVPADLAGIRMRTVGAPVWLETIRAIGATPTPMPWTETYSAIQQKVIDGAEAQLPAVYGSRLYEVVKYITTTGHFFRITGLVTSAKWFDSLPEKYRKVLRDEALKSGDYTSKMTIDTVPQYQKMMEEKGVVFSNPDVKPFKDAIKVVYDKLDLNDLKKQVDGVLGR